MERVVVYELSDGSKQCFSGFNAPEDEAHERAAAEREMASRETAVVGFHFEWRASVPARVWKEQ